MLFVMLPYTHFPNCALSTSVAILLAHASSSYTLSLVEENSENMCSNNSTIPGP